MKHHVGIPDFNNICLTFDEKEYGDIETTNIIRHLILIFTKHYIYVTVNVNGLECFVFLTTPGEVTVIRERGHFSKCQQISGTASCNEFVARSGEYMAGFWLAKKSGDNSRAFAKLKSKVKSLDSLNKRCCVHYANISKTVPMKLPVIQNMGKSCTRKNKNCTEANVISLKRHILCICPNDKRTLERPANYRTIEEKPIQETDGREQATQQASESCSNDHAVNSDILVDNSDRETPNSKSHENRRNGIVRDNSCSHVIGKCRYPSYDTYDKRINSFKAWIHSKPSTDECADAGFYFKGPVDLVRCFCCGIGLKDFSEADVPMEEHIKYAPKCAYLENIFGAEELKRRMQEIKSMEPENIRQRQYLAFKRNISSDVMNKPYRHLGMSTSGKRLETFRNPNFLSVISPEKLADAGLFYTGEGDLVRCFACDGGFRNWELNDDPWTQHCRWFPSCRFAREVKGDAFIENVQQATTKAAPNTEAADGHQNDLQYDRDLVALKVAIVGDMGFSDDTFKKAVTRLQKNGTIPSIEDIVGVIESMNITETTERNDDMNILEDPLTENQRLKNLLLCMRCKLKDANVLFLPCAHHRMCMDCARGIETCPVCQQTIQTTVQTFLS